MGELLLQCQKVEGYQRLRDEFDDTTSCCLSAKSAGDEGKSTTGPHYDRARLQDALQPGLKNNPEGKGVRVTSCLL